jgi:hypothetical protein
VSVCAFTTSSAARALCLTCCCTLHHGQQTATMNLHDCATACHLLQEHQSQESTKLKTHDLCSTMISSSCPKQRWAQHTAQPAVLLLCLLALCTLALPAAAAIPFQQSAVDWTLVPDKPEAAANLSTSCICALLNGTCTPGCCCDTACPVELLQSFKDAGQCLPEGTPPQQLHYCIPAEPFAKASMRCKWSGLSGT